MLRFTSYATKFKQKTTEEYKKVHNLVCVSGYAYWEDLIKSVHFDHPNLTTTNFYTERKQLKGKKHSNTRKKYGI